DRTDSQTALDETDIIEIDDGLIEQVPEVPEMHHEDPAPPTDPVDENRPNDPSEGDAMSNHPMTEAKPWDAVVDGTLNGAAYSATGYFGMASLAYEYMTEHDVPVQRDRKSVV